MAEVPAFPPIQLARRAPGAAVCVVVPLVAGYAAMTARRRVDHLPLIALARRVIVALPTGVQSRSEARCRAADATRVAGEARPVLGADLVWF